MWGLNLSRLKGVLCKRRFRPVSEIEDRCRRPSRRTAYVQQHY